MTNFDHIELVKFDHLVIKHLDDIYNFKYRFIYIYLFSVSEAINKIFIDRLYRKYLGFKCTPKSKVLKCVKYSI